MSIQYVNTGSSPNKGDGDSLRTAFGKINYNFSQFEGMINGSSATISINSFPPVNPGEGELWYDTVSGRSFIYYDNSWVDANPTSVEPVPWTTVTSHILPASDLQYDLGSPTQQWRSLYVGTGTIYIGNIPITVNTTNNTLLVGNTPGESPTSATSVATESFVIDYVNQNSGGNNNAFDTITVNGQPAATANNTTEFELIAGSGINITGNTGTNQITFSSTGQGLPNITIPAESGSAYKGLQVAYGRVYSNSNSSELNVNKIVIHKPAASTVTIDPTSSQDNFQVSGIGSSDVVAMFVLYGDVNGPKPVSTLQAFAQAVIDTVILDGGQEGQYNSVEAMKTAFYANYTTLSTAAGGLYQNFQFFLTNPSTLNGGPTTVREGSGAVFEISDLGDGTYNPAGIQSNGTNYLPGHKIKVLGTSLGGATPDNDCIITIDSISEGGLIFQWSVSGTAAGNVVATYAPVTGTNYNVGSGFIVASVSNSGVSASSYGSNYVVGDVLTLLGENITGGTTPTNNITITVNAVDGLGQAYGYTSAGTVPQVWPTNFISDGGEDQYDTANYISTNLANNIAYNGGNTVSDGTAAFGTGSSYSFVYNTGTFALFATGTNVTLIRTSGNSGADGNSVTDSGHIYGPSTTTSTYDNAVTHLNLVGDVYAGPLVTFVKADNTNTVDILIADDGAGAGVGITRDSANGIYNPYRDNGWDGDVSPSGTLWNIDGWSDFTDVETRTYTNLFAAFGNGGLGNKIVGTECVMHLPDNGKYYAVKFTQWTQGGGGGFAYTRRELDLNNLQQGVKFSDGTILKSAEGVGRVKLTAPSSRRIEEVYGYKQVSVTGVITTDLTATASRVASGENRFWIDSTATTIDNILNDTAAAGIWETNTIEFSLDNSTWYKWNGSTSFNGTERGYAVTLPSGTLAYNEGDTVYFRYNTGGEPVVWWDSADLPGGAGNFRGAIIKYHAYITDAGSMVGTIHIAKDSGDDNVAHTEVLSGGTDGENAILWYQDDEDQLKYKRIDGESSTVKIQWSATVFYGSEVWD